MLILFFSDVDLEFALLLLFFLKQQHFPSTGSNCVWKRTSSIWQKPEESSPVSYRQSSLHQAARLRLFPQFSLSPLPTLSVLLLSLSSLGILFYLQFSSVDPNLLASHHGAVCEGFYRGHAQPGILSHQLLL